MKKIFAQLLLIFTLSFYCWSVKADEIQILNECQQALEPVSIYTVLDTTRNTLSGWSHIDVETDEYRNLIFSNEEYAITSSNYQFASDCNGQNVLSAILVVKISDWNRQHSSGLEATIDVEDISFEKVTHVLIDLKIHSNKTRVPSVDFLEKKYGDLLKGENIDDLELGEVNLGITLFEKGALDQASESFNAEYILSIDHSMFADKWLRIKLPIAAFETYTQKNYSNTSALLKDYANVPIFGFRINPETSKGKQLRNLIGNQWHEGIPETFKEISLSLSRVEFLNLNKH